MECALFAETLPVPTYTMVPGCVITAGGSFVVVYSKLQRARQYSLAHSNVESAPPAGTRTVSWLECDHCGLSLRQLLQKGNHQRGYCPAVHGT